MKTRNGVLGIRRAATLVEVTLALALAAIVVFVGVRAYDVASENERVRQAISLIGFARDAINSRYGVNIKTDYSGLSNSLVQSAFAPSLVTSGGDGVKISDPFRGELKVGADSFNRSGDSSYISLTNLTTDACVKLSRADMGRDAAFILVDPTGAGGPVGAAMQLPLSDSDRAAVDQRCKAANRVAVSWQFVPGHSGGGGILPFPIDDPVTLGKAIKDGVKGYGDWTGWDWFFGQVAQNTLFLRADVQHYSWASTDPMDPIITSNQLIRDTLNGFSGNESHCDWNRCCFCWTPDDLSLAVSYLQNVAIPARAGGDAALQAAMMTYVYTAAKDLYTTGKNRGYPGF